MGTHPPKSEILVFRPSRRPLWWLIPVGVLFSVLVGGLTLREWPAAMSVAVTALVVLTFAPIVLLRIVARTAIEPGGLRVRAIGERLFAWSEIRDVDIMRTFMGDVVRVAMDNGFVMALSAPRGGMFGGNRRVNEAVAAIRSRVAAARAEAADREQAARWGDADGPGADGPGADGPGADGPGVGGPGGGGPGVPPT